MKKLIKTIETGTKNTTGIKRVYLINKALLKAGFRKKCKYSYSIDFNTKKVSISSDHTKYKYLGTVGGKEIKGDMVSLLDIDNNKIKTVFKGISKCNVDIYENEVILTPLQYIEDSEEQCEEHVKEGIVKKASNVVHMLRRKKARNRYVIPINSLDILLQKVSGDNINLSQKSLLDMGFEWEYKYDDTISCLDNAYKKHTQVNLVNEDSLNAIKTACLLSDFTYFEMFAGSGIGGMALDKYGCKNVGYSEIDKYAIKNYDANFPGRVNLGDITKINSVDVPDSDIIIFGSPCQNISLMSRTWSEDKKVQGLNGQESSLFFEAMRIINDKKPKYIIFENVRELLNSNDGRDFEVVKRMFTENYNIKWNVMNTSDYGVPHTRRRLYVVGQRKDLAPTFDFCFPKPQKLELTMQDLLEEAVDDKYFLTHAMKETVMSTGTGKWFAKPETDLPIARTLTATMAKMHRASQDNYVTSEKYCPINKTNLRRLTPLECTRLQGLAKIVVENGVKKIVDTYKLVVSDTQAYKIMGNAMSFNVVDILVKTLAIYIRKNIISKLKVVPSV